MKNIRALQLTQYGGVDATKISLTQAPTAGAHQVLVRVHAAGINALDWKVREGYVRDAFPLELPTVLGIELSGVVEDVGPGVTRFSKGDRVMGPLGRLGAYAELVAVDEANLASIPQAMSFVEAAALPVAAVSAWQSLHFAGPIQPKQRILIHGAAGALGGFAIQFARRAGAEVFTTTKASHIDYVRGLGSSTAIDYESEQFENKAKDIDLVLDYAGGDVLARSWDVLSAGGAIVSTASPAILAATPAGRRGLWFMNKPDAERLGQIAEEVSGGQLQSRIAAVVSFDEIPEAIERSRTLPQLGKTVANFQL